MKTTPKTIAIATAVALASAAAVALANNQPRDAKEQAINYARSLGQAVTVTTEIDAADTECLTTVGAGSTCRLYSFDSMTVVKPTGIGTCCWSQNRTGVTLGTQSNEAEGQLTFATVAEACPGYSFAANEPHDFIPVLRNLKSHGAGIYLGRYCNVGVQAAGGDWSYPPCSSSSECHTATGDSNSICLDPRTEQNAFNESQGGAYLFCRPAANDTRFAAATER